MKKLGVLAVVAMLAVSCNSKPGVNHGVLPVEHESYTAEDVHHAGGHGEHESSHEEATHEVADSTATHHTEEVNDTVKAHK
jgi:hypothetical protein